MALPVRDDDVPTTYLHIARNMLAAAIYNRRCVRYDSSLKTWDEIRKDPRLREFYLTAADEAMAHLFPGGGY
jgi:hypothetical protein